MLYRLTLNSHKSLLSRYTAGYISDTNKHRICSKVNIDKTISLFNSQVCSNGIFCALVDSSQPAMPMLFQYSGSLAQRLTRMNFSCNAADMHGLPSYSWMTAYRNVTLTETIVMEFTDECLTVFWTYVHAFLCVYFWLLGTWAKMTRSRWSYIQTYTF